MDYFISDPIGLILAFINVSTVVILIYMFLEVAAGDRSKLYRTLDRIFKPVLTPLRRILPAWRIDPASIILIAVFQLIAFAIKRVYR
ncbi:MAG: YggT family protein [bacterium]|nr:MAG: YggT family protein [bacterium]